MEHIAMPGMRLQEQAEADENGGAYRYGACEDLAALEDGPGDRGAVAAVENSAADSEEGGQQEDHTDQ